MMSLGPLVLSAALACGPQVVLVDSDSAASTTGFTTTTTTSSSGTTSEVATGDGATAPTSTTGELVCEPPVGEPGALASLLHATGQGKQTLQAVKFDGAGNTYAGGNFTRELKVGGAMTTVMGDLAAPFVAKFDCAGELLWLSVGEPEANATGTAGALAVADEEVFIGGSIAGTLGFPSGTIEGGPGGAFVARFEAATGALLAGRVLGEGATAVHALALADGSIHAAGSCADPDVPETFGILHAQLDLELGPVAPRCLYSPALPPSMDQARVATSARAVAVAADGDVILAGQITGPLDDGTVPVVSGDADGFVARLQLPLAAGPMLFDGGWITTLGDTERRDRVNGMALADNGDVIAVGLGHGKFFPQNPPGCESTSGDLYTAFVTRLAAGDGACVAHQMLESDALQATEAHGVATRGQDIYVLGQFGRSLGIAGEPVVPSGAAEAGVRMFLLGLGEGWEVKTSYISEQVDSDIPCISDDEPRALGYDLAAGPDVVMAVADACGGGVELDGTPIEDSDAFLAGFVPAQ
ncbi:hypothetical protein OV090_45305 [Nannocystis sp. RBIL2]|uniref:hypothetical protein n=1 Tax=Nannocystis sp. RBIL2 TaxID=2996788 RepID=UPI0022718B1F|nr:hypothetical protein [Nannocystis sp. RBIL2]MCY1072048.1 hypothetical protein [Nannocystis sp. RBIL2]